MFITPSFKKSLIVEQFQGNYLKFANLTTNMAARGYIRKTMFLPNLVSRLQYCLLLPSKISIPLAISNGKSFF